MRLSVVSTRSVVPPGLRLAITPSGMLSTTAISMPAATSWSVRGR